MPSWFPNVSYNGQSASSATPSFDQWKKALGDGKFGNIYMKDGRLSRNDGPAHVKQFTDDELMEMYRQQYGIAAPQTPEDKEKANQDAFDQELRAFIRQMSAPLDENDPEVQRAMNMGVGQANRQARLRGLDGTVAATEAARASQEALNPIRQHRQSLATQAMGIRSGNMLGLGQLREGARRYDYEQNLASYDRDFQAKQAPWQALGGLLGGAAGGMLGGPTMIGPGSQMGSGLGGLGAGQYQAPTLRSYKKYGGNY